MVIMQHARVKSNTNAPNGTKTFDEFTVDVTTLPALMIIIEGEIAHPVITMAEL